MSRDEAVALIQEILGFRGDQEDAIIRRLIMTQDLLEQGRTLPWFLLEDDVNLAVVANAHPSLPSGFIREARRDYDLLSGVYYWDDDDEETPVYLRKLSFDEARKTYGEVSDERPIAYAIKESTLHLFPLPNEDMTLKWSYYKKDERLESNIENQWLTHAPYLLIGNAGQSMASTLNKKQAMTEFGAMAQAAQSAIFKEHILRETEGRKFIFGRKAS